MALLSNDDTDGLTKAKLRLYQAAGQIDPLASLRKRPLTTLGVAAMVGFVLGNQRGTVQKVVTTTRKTGLFMRFATPLLGTAARLAMAKFAQYQQSQAAAAQQYAAAEQTAMHSEGGFAG